MYLCRTVFLNVFAGWTRALCLAVHFPLLLSYPAWVALRPMTYFCFPRAVLISGTQLARVLRSRAKVIQKIGKWLSGQKLGEKNRKMQSSVKGKHEDLLPGIEGGAARHPEIRRTPAGVAGRAEFRCRICIKCMSQGPRPLTPAPPKSLPKVISFQTSISAPIFSSKICKICEN